MLAFDDGDLSENSTFLISDWIVHTPKEVLAKNFDVDESDFADIPKSDFLLKLYSVK